MHAPPLVEKKITSKKSRTWIGVEAGLSGKAPFIRKRMDTEYPQEKFHEVLSSLKGQQDNSFDSKVFHLRIFNIIKRERRPLFDLTRALFHRGSRGEEKAQ